MIIAETVLKAEFLTGLVLLIIGIGIQIAAAQLAAKKNKQKFPDEEDDSPSTITTRGAWLQAIWGVHRVAPVVGWVGNRRERHVRRTLPQDIVEDAWHLITVGRCTALTAIWKDGKLLWSGRITPESHPSGTTINFKITGFLSTFRIYWGEDDQPIDDIVSANVTINSRWPGVCYIVIFDQKIGTKGSTTAWPTLEYEITSRPIESDLQTSKWFHNADEISGLGIDPINVLLNGAPGVGFIEVAKNVTSDYFPGRAVTVAGQPLSALTVKSTSFIKNTLISSTPGDLTTWTKVPSTDGTDAVFTPTVLLPQLTSPPGVEGIQYLLSTRKTLAEDVSGYTITNVDLFQKVGMFAEFSIYMHMSFRDEFSISQFRLSILNGSDEELVRGDFTPDFRTQKWNVDKITSPLGKPDIKATALFVSGLWTKLTVSVRITAAEAGTTKKVLIRPGASSFVIDTARTRLGSVVSLHKVLVIAPLSSQTDITRIFFQETLTGWTPDTGTLTPTIPTTVEFNGANAAAILDELFFLESPRGSGLDKTVFDRSSLATIGNTLDTTAERAASHAIARGGTDAREIINDIMVDFGIVLPWDYSLGKYVFKLNRKAPVSNTIIPESLLEGIPPLIISNLLSKFAPKIVYPFKDRERNFTTSTISIDDDGQIAAIANQRATKISLKTVTDFKGAGILSTRKDLEHPSNAAGAELTASRAARYLLPGDILSVEGLPELIRVVETTPQASSTQVKIDGTFSIYGENAVTGNILKGGGISPVLLAADDLQTDILELDYPVVPRFSEVKLVIARIRAHTGIIAANILISEDEVIYTSIKAIDTHAIGGVLSKNISSSSGNDPDIEPIEFTPAGGLDDFASFPLIEDLDSLRSGKLVARIGEEWIFFAGIQQVDDSPITFRLLECMRGRLHSKTTSHDINDKIYLMDPDQNSETIIGLDFIQNPSIKADQKLSYKIQSLAADALEEPITPDIFIPQGLATIPRGMTFLGALEGRLVYTTTAGIDVFWSVYSDSAADAPSKFSAGDFPFGQRHDDINATGGSPHKAFLEIRSDPGEELKTTIATALSGGKMDTGFAISQTTISNAFDGEHPASFQLWGFLKDGNIKSLYRKVIISKRT